MFRIALLAATVALVACGGGGSGGSSVAAPAVVAASAEGFWNGTGSNGVAMSMVILENGETWGLYGSSSSINGAFFGSTSVNGTSVLISGSAFDFVSRASSSGTLTGSVATKSTLNVVSSAGTTLNAAYNAQYDQTPSMANLAGTYSGQAVTGNTAPQTAIVTISAAGVVSSVGTGCTTSGTATPRATGKNIFNISVTSTGPSCALGNGTVATGIASFNPATRQLVSMAMNPAKSDGFIYVGTR